MRIASSADEHEDESRGSTQSPPSTVSPERTSHEIPGQLESPRESLDNFLALHSISHPVVRHSVASFDEYLKNLKNDGEFPSERPVPTRPSGSTEIDLGFESETLASTRHQMNPTQQPTQPLDQLGARPTNTPPFNTSLLLQPTDFSNAEPNRYLPTIFVTHDRSPAAILDPMDSTPSTATATASPNPGSIQPCPPSSTLRAPASTLIPPSINSTQTISRKRDRHHRRFVRWVKKRFRTQMPWSAGHPHTPTDSEKAVRWVERQGL